MSDGQGCTCFAVCARECCCEGVDWRSTREVELEAENEALSRKLQEFQKLYWKLLEDK